MVVVTGAVVGAIATFPPAVALLTQAGATAVGSAIVPTVAAAEDIAGGLGGAVLAVGEGAVVGAGVIGTGGSGSAGIALATLVGPIGWAVVGCQKNEDQHGESGYTWDCWKPVDQDTSLRLSEAMTLRRLAAHPNVRSTSLDQGGFFMENTLGERFRLTPVSVEETLAFHASIFSS